MIFFGEERFFPSGGSDKKGSIMLSFYSIQDPGSGFIVSDTVWQVLKNGIGVF